MSEGKLAERLFSTGEGFVHATEGFGIDSDTLQRDYEVVARFGARGMSEQQIAEQATVLGGRFYSESGIGSGIVVYDSREAEDEK